MPLEKTLYFKSRYASVLYYQVFLKEVLSPCSKKYIYLLQWKPIKHDEKCFLFNIKALFVLVIFKLFSWLFGHIEKTGWLERSG